MTEDRQRPSTAIRAVALVAACALFCLVGVGPAGAAQLEKLNFDFAGPFDKDEGVAADPADGDLLVIDAAGTNERQRIVFTAPWANGETFTLGNLPGSCAGATTSPIAFAGNVALRRNVDEAIEAQCGAGSSSVVIATVPAGAQQALQVTFEGPLARTDVPLMGCATVTGAGACAVDQPDAGFPDGAGARLYRVNSEGEPDDFDALGTNVLDGRDGADQTPDGSVLGSELAPGEVQVAVAPPGAVGAGDLYLTNASGNLIDVFSAQGEFLGRLSEADGAPIGKACGVAVDPQGAVYVADHTGNAIHKYSPAAGPASNADWEASFPFAEPCSLAAGSGPSEGALFATHFGGTVEKLDGADGATQYIVSAAATTTIGADFGTGLLWTADGATVRAFDASGSAPVAAIESPATMPAAVEGIAALNDDVFVARAGFGRIEAYLRTPERAPLAITGGSGPGPEQPLARFAGQVIPRGGKIFACHFEYGPTSAYGARVPCEQGQAAIGVGEDPVAVSAISEPLEPDTTYHYRLVAANFSFAGAGGDRTLTTGPAPPDPCPNAAIRAQQGIRAILLPGCMALEMVSEPAKANKGAGEPSISAGGERVRLRSSAAMGGTPGVLGLGGDPYVATRTSAGWRVSPTSPPTPLTTGWAYDNGVATAASLSPDFSCWVQIARTTAEREAGIDTAYRGCVDGSFAPISPPLDGPRTQFGSTFLAASADHRLYFHPGQPQSGSPVPSIAYRAGDPVPTGPGSMANAYVVGSGGDGPPALALVAAGLDAKTGRAKAWGGNCGAIVGGPDKRNQGAVSVDGDHVYLTTRPGQPASGECSVANRLRILERLETPTEVFVRELFPSPAGVGDDLYQGASADQSKVYFTTNRPLAATDLDSGADCSVNPGASTACDLYLYDAERPPAERLIQVSAGEDVTGEHDAGAEARVLNGTVAIAGDGSHVYFAAEGVLTDAPNPQGERAGDHPAATPKLYAYDAEQGELAFVGALVATDNGANALWGTTGTFTNSAYPVPALGDGHVLLLITGAALTADDEDNGREDLYRYDARAHELQRLSRGEPGASDNGPFAVERRGKPFFPLGTDYAEDGRWASEDGRTAVFVSAEPLVLGDGNERADAYMWRAGELHRLPGGGAPTLSHDGRTVAFGTGARLLPQDGDGAGDVYVARAGGGFPVAPPPPPPCQPDRSQPGPQCRAQAPPAPGPTGTASAGLAGAGNVSSRPRPRPCAKKKGKRGAKGKCAKRKRAKGKRTKQKRRKVKRDRRAAK